jgi:lipopolysaccharide/colanic/teichoic acid biosynthesis glycosyltransferase
MLPFFMVAALIIKLETPGPLLYEAEWLGQYGRRFMLYRLRTMTNTVDMEQRRFTRFGAWMRKISLDESAALINVFKGELSFFGPRLLRPNETDLRDPRCRRILQVLPGMSSPSLVRYGFERVSLPQQLDLDEVYLEQRSLRYDFHLFWKTLRAIYHHAHREAL